MSIVQLKKKIQILHRLIRPSRRSFLFTDLTHEDIKDPRGDGQREGGEEDSEEP